MTCDGSEKTQTCCGLPCGTLETPSRTCGAFLTFELHAGRSSRARRRWQKHICSRLTSTSAKRRSPNILGHFRKAPYSSSANFGESFRRSSFLCWSKSPLALAKYLTVQALLNQLEHASAACVTS